MDAIEALQEVRSKLVLWYENGRALTPNETWGFKIGMFVAIDLLDGQIVQCGGERQKRPPMPEWNIAWPTSKATGQELVGGMGDGQRNRTGNYPPDIRRMREGQ